MPANINTDSNYYLEDEGLKNLSLYEIVQMDKSFFEKYNYKEEDFKKHVQKLYSEFFPGFTSRLNENDRQNTSSQAQTIWIMILAAVLHFKKCKNSPPIF